MTTIVEYFSEVSEPYPRWLYEGDYSLRNFFRSRTVLYPGVGADGRPLDIFNPSHSAHCYFFVDQIYSAACLDQQTGDIPTGYKVIHDNQFSVDELKRESVSLLSVNSLRQFSTLPRARVVSSSRDYRSQDGSILAVVDSASAVRLLIYERQLGYLPVIAIARRGGCRNFDTPSLFAHADSLCHMPGIRRRAQPNDRSLQFAPLTNGSASCRFSESCEHMANNVPDRPDARPEVLAHRSRHRGRHYAGLQESRFDQGRASQHPCTRHRRYGTRALRHASCLSAVSSMSVRIVVPEAGQDTC